MGRVSACRGHACGVTPLRIPLAAAIAVAAGASGHVSVSGTALPSLGRLVGLWAVLSVVGILLRCREWRLGGLAAGMLVAQVAVHALASPGGAGQGSFAANPFICDISNAEHLGGNTLAALLMIVIHVAVTAATVVWLRRGERWLWARACSAARSTLQRVARAADVQPRAAWHHSSLVVHVRPWSFVPPAHVQICRALSRRGPPGFLVLV